MAAAPLKRDWLIPNLAPEIEIVDGRAVLRSDPPADEIARFMAFIHNYAVWLDDADMLKAAKEGIAAGDPQGMLHAIFLVGSYAGVRASCDREAITSTLVKLEEARRKGGSKRGARSGLAPEVVREIRKYYASLGGAHGAIEATARKFGVSRPTVKKYVKAG